MSSSPTGLEVTAKIFPLAFIALLFKPTVEIDGQKATIGWTKPNFLPVVPGAHRITIYWKYLGFLSANSVTTTVTITDGQVAHLLYKCRWLIFLPGKVAVS